jgi:Spy/CpxP family protein refolding chaperone
MNERMRRFGLSIGATLIAVGFGAGALTATQNTSGPQPPFMAGRMGQGFLGPFGPLLARLDLTDAQKSQVKTIMQSHADEFKTLGTREATARQALNAAEAADTLDDDTIRQKSADVAVVDADMAVARAHLRAEVFQVLTADQKTAANQLMTRRQGRGM